MQEKEFTETVILSNLSGSFSVWAYLILGLKILDTGNKWYMISERIGSRNQP